MNALEQPIEIRQIVKALGGRLRGDAAPPIIALASLETALPGAITFIASDQYLAALQATQASVVIMSEKHADLYAGTALLVDNPYVYYARLTQWWKNHLQSLRPPVENRIAPTAVIYPSAQVANSAIIGPGAVVCAHAVVGEHVCVGAQTYIGEDVAIGEYSCFDPHVTIMNGCRIGKHVIIHSGTVIGSDGFGFAPEKKEWVKIEQLGAVFIGDDVEIGANTCIDRGAIEDTIIGNGVKLDNLIQIGHNVHIGEHTAMAACVGVSGSTHIGKRCMFGGAVGVAGHIEIVDDVVVMAATNVTRSITRPGYYSGIVPFDEATAWRKNAAMFRQLSTMRERIRELEKQVSNFNNLIIGKAHDES